MCLEISPATPADAPRIAEIHMAAFGDNAMLLSLFPTPDIRKGLQKSVELKALQDIESPMTTVFVVREPGRDGDGSQRVIAFAKWSHPVRDGENYIEAPRVWPEGSNIAKLAAWAEATDVAQEHVLANTPCYRESSLLPT